MCGIFAYAGKENKAGEIIISGLQRLEYRGYDSWGIAVTEANGIAIQKQVGAIGDLSSMVNLPPSSIGIGHTRWATHGGVTQTNAHPHYSSDSSFVLAQNGIVENHQALKTMLEQKGYAFKTETDTEVIVRLIESEQEYHPRIEDAVRAAFQKLTGRNTIIILTRDNQIIAARNGSPLVIGIAENGDYFFSSDTLSFAPYAKKMIVVDNGQLVTYNKNELTISSLTTGNVVPQHIEPVTFQVSDVNKAGFDHFMIKEIFESPFVVKQLINQPGGEIERLAKAIKAAGHVYVCGSGTAGIAAAQIAYYLRAIARVNAISLVGADAKEYYHLFTKRDIIIAPSQSGETADVLEVLEFAKQKGMQIASFVNMPGSMMTKLSNYKLMADAGPEICVMSTKVLVSQIAFGYLLAHAVNGDTKEAKRKLQQLSLRTRDYLSEKQNLATLQKIAKLLLPKKDIFLLGKGENFQIMREGMVKMIEATYKHAHAIPAGDLKHYAITLIEKGVPVIAAINSDALKTDIETALAEVKTRGATTIAIATEPNDKADYTILVPDTGDCQAIINVIPLQLLAYYMTVAMGHNVDKPRNIAKSVTVK